MNLTTGETADNFFGGVVPPAAHALLHQAAAAAPADRAALLWTAHAIAPDCLAVYYTLYKHHAGRREFALAERAAWRGLSEAALQAGLAADWRAVAPDPAQAAGFWQQGPARFWLFTLKALCFIHLRNEKPDIARALLARIELLGPQARIGSDVTAALLAAMPDGNGTAPPGASGASGASGAAGAAAG